MKLLFLFLTLIACQTSHSDLAHSEMTTYAKKASKEKGLVLEGMGGAMMGDIQELEMIFVSAHHSSLAEARKLMVSTIEEFLIQINSNPQIRPHLHTYPMTAHNLSLSISFRDSQNNYPPPEYIALTFIANGNIVYARRVNDRFCDHYKEPIEEAFALVKAETL